MLIIIFIDLYKILYRILTRLTIIVNGVKYMSKREEAIKLMEQLRNCTPKPLFEKISNEEKGIRFILGYLNKHDGEEIIAKDLADKMNISTARISVLLKKMADKELIIKSEVKGDTRKTKIELSKKGKEITKAFHEKMIKAHERILDKVSEKEIKSFLRISKKISEVIKEFSSED